MAAKRNLKFLFILLLSGFSFLFINANSMTEGDPPDEKVLISDEIKIASLSYIPKKWDKEANLATMVKMATNKMIL